MPHDPSTLNALLVEALRQSVQDPSLLNAFRAVPRHAFVPVFLHRSLDEGNQQHWRTISSEVDADEWLTEVYKNRPLTISLDQYGDPNSSSSQPDLMALMIQSVCLQPGSRVLEIGTGTGYNAAILGTLVGCHNVVTIDINEQLLAEAQARVERIVGPGMTFLHADGRSLPEQLSGGTFDAIMVTGSHDRIEPSWVKALAPGGHLVVNWKRSFANVMIEAEKIQSRLIGRVAPYGGDFMALHDGAGLERGRSPYQPLGLVACSEFRPQLFEDRDFGFFLQIKKPSLFYHRHRTRSGDLAYVVMESTGSRVLYFFPVKIRGDASLWQEISQVSEQYEQLKRPSRSAFQLIVEEDGQMTFRYHEHIFPL